MMTWAYFSELIHVERSSICGGFVEVQSGGGSRRPNQANDLRT
jgi:hypothetical protein